MFLVILWLQHTTKHSKSSFSSLLPSISTLFAHTWQVSTKTDVSGQNMLQPKGFHEVDASGATGVKCLAQGH